MCDGAPGAILGAYSLTSINHHSVNKIHIYPYTGTADKNPHLEFFSDSELIHCRLILHPMFVCN